MAAINYGGRAVSAYRSYITIKRQAVIIDTIRMLVTIPFSLISVAVTSASVGAANAAAGTVVSAPVASNKFFAEYDAILPGTFVQKFTIGINGNIFSPALKGSAGFAFAGADAVRLAKSGLTGGREFEFDTTGITKATFAAGFGAEIAWDFFVRRNTSPESIALAKIGASLKFAASVSVADAATGAAQLDLGDKFTFEAYLWPSFKFEIDIVPGLYPSLAKTFKLS